MSLITRTRAIHVTLLAGLATAVLGGAAHAAPVGSDPVASVGAGASKRSHCDPGEFCIWPQQFYRSKSYRTDLRNANPNECIPLPDDIDGHSLTNRTTRDITVYQGRDCSTEGDFTTYPGHGTYVPQAHFVVRAYQIWG